jgi:hypothetical protein
VEPRTTRSHGRSVHALRSTSVPGSATSTSSRSRTVTPAVASSSARSQAIGSRRRFQTSTVIGMSPPHGVRRPASRRTYRTSRSPSRAHTALTTSSISVTTPRTFAIGTSIALPKTIRTIAAMTRAAIGQP